MRIVSERHRTVQVGDVFERLTVIGVPFYAVTTQSNRALPHVVCQCACGTVVVAKCGMLAQGQSKSCGCMRREMCAALGFRRGMDKGGCYKHGGAKGRLYDILRGMHARCENPAMPNYPDYGGRGIRVCDEWCDFVTFREWALSHGYRDDLSIDRIDNDGPYSPENCRWADKVTQCNNTRANRVLEAFGETKTVAEWLRDDRCTVTRGPLIGRIERGLDVEAALTTPITEPVRDPVTGRLGSPWEQAGTIGTYTRRP